MAIARYLQLVRPARRLKSAVMAQSPVLPAASSMGNNDRILMTCYLYYVVA